MSEFALKALQDSYAEPEPHSWTPANLVQLAANPPEPPTIGGLLYPGKRTVLSGETESLKTWLALILCKAEIEIGRVAAWVDIDAMGPGYILERLQLLGLTDDQIGDQFLYYQPSEALGLDIIQELAATIDAHGIRLFVIDAFNPMLSLQGADPNKTPDIDKFWRTICDPICHAGAAPVLLDHVVKNSENRGKYSYGSERKASGAIVHIGFRILEPLTKGGRGRTLLTVHKDRPGYLPRPTLGRLILDASADNVITYTLEPDKSHDPESGGFRPTILMERISKTLEPLSEPCSRTWVEENVQGNREALRTALGVLTEDAYITAAQGPRNATLYTSIRPYREADYNQTATPPSPRPHPAQDLHSDDLRPRPPEPPPYGGGEAGRSQMVDGADSAQPPPRPRALSAGDLILEYEFEPDMQEPEPFDHSPA